MLYKFSNYRSKIIILFICFIACIVSTLQISSSKENNYNNKTQLLPNEAKKAFAYLNKIRANPTKYSQSIGVDLSYIAPSKKLKWNNLLAKVAQEKAIDMAQRNYFSHVTPECYGINYLLFKAGYYTKIELIKDSTANGFESISAGYSDGKESVKSLIIDEDVPSLGHRNHLLGYGEWFASLNEIGIGYARNRQSHYEYYVCIIIAKNNFDN
jgi:uncharacterized protein YkwD